LEFLPSPQVIPRFCNSGGFGPRRGLTPASPCPWRAHPVSGLIPATLSPRSGSLSLRLRGSARRLTRPGPQARAAAEINSPDHSTKGTPSHARAGPKARRDRAPTARGRRVSGSLSSPSRGAFHHSLTVLVRYRWPDVCGLGGWSPRLPAGFRVPRGTQGRRHRSRASGRRLRGSHPLRRGFPAASPGPSRPTGCAAPPYNPAALALAGARRFGPPPVRSPLLRGSRLISLPPGTEMFQFPGCPPARLCIRRPVRRLAAGAGCPIRNRPAHRSLAAPRPRFAALRVLPRHLAPRHPPCAPPSLAHHSAIHAQFARWALAPSVSVLSSRLLVRFGEIEQHLTMRLCKVRHSAPALGNWRVGTSRQLSIRAIQTHRTRSDATQEPLGRIVST